MIYGQYLTIQPWTTQSSPLQEFLENVVAWIRIPSLLGAPYKRRILRAFGQLVGKVFKIDLQIDKMVWGQFARFEVQLTLRKPLVSKVRVANSIHRLDYEFLPMICFSCGTYGHMRENCAKVQNTDRMEEEEEEDMANENLGRMKHQPKSRLKRELKRRSMVNG